MRNDETKRDNYMEGLGAARYEQVVGRQVERGKIEGVDIVDPKLGNISLKGPLGIRASNGERFKITDEMVAGLGKAVVEDVLYKVATKTIVVDVLGMTPKQIETLIDIIRKGVGPTHERRLCLSIDATYVPIVRCVSRPT